MQRLLWNQDPQINDAYFAWKYEENPYLRRQPVIHVALSGGEVVGMRGIFGARWHAGDPSQALPFMHAGDMLIRPEHRRKGLFREIISASIDDMKHHGIRYLLSFSASPTTFIGSVRMGWRCAGSYMPSRRETTRAVVRRSLRRVVRTPPLPALSPLRALSSRLAEPDVFARLDRRAEDAARRGFCVEKTPRPEAMARLIERLGFSGRFQHVRDAEYFGWRFRDPRSRFRFIFSGDGELGGYIALRASTGRDRTFVDIVDWQGTSGEVLRELLRTAIDIGRFERVRTWCVSLSADKVAALWEAGFKAGKGRIEDVQGRPVSGFPGLLVHPSRAELAEGRWSMAGRRLDDIGSWDLQMLCSD